MERIGNFKNDFHFLRRIWAACDILSHFNLILCRTYQQVTFRKKHHQPVVQRGGSGRILGAGICGQWGE